MNIEQFKVLRHIAENGAFSSWEITADDLRMPVVRIRKALDDLIEIGYINGYDHPGVFEGAEAGEEHVQLYGHRRRRRRGGPCHLLRGQPGRNPGGDLF